MKSFKAAAVIISLGGAMSTSALAAKYSVVDLGVLPPGYGSHASAINNHGLSVGWSEVAMGDAATLYQGGAVSDLSTRLGSPFYSHATGISDTGLIVGSMGNGVDYSRGFITNAKTGSTMILGTLAGGSSSRAQGVNNAGVVVGSATNAYGVNRAFRYAGGVMTDLGTLAGGSSSAATDVNNHGQIVGVSDTAGGAKHAFVYHAGAFTDLGTFAGGGDSGANAINDLGQVVGSAVDSTGHNKAFLYSGSTMLDLGVLSGGATSAALGINKWGDVVGTSDTGRMSHAFLYSKGSMLDLNAEIDPADAMDWVLNEATGINSLGQIVGRGRLMGDTHAFLLTPMERAVPAGFPAAVPEPEQWALVLTGLMVVGAMARRQQGRASR